MREFVDKKEQICSKILEFRKELYRQILKGQNNKDLKLRFELYMLELTLERAIYIIALNEAVRELENNDFTDTKASDDLYYKIIECNERLFSLLEEELDLLDERAYDECRAL